MKKFMLFAAVLAVALIVLGVAGFAYAQSQTPTVPNRGYGAGMMGGAGRGMMAGGGMMSGRGMMANGSVGPMHTYMIQALADKLGMTVEDLQARLDKGETPYQVAQSQGLTDEQVTDLMEQAHDTALKAAVAAGTISQEQADWMDSHMEQMWQNGGTGFGACHGDTAVSPTSSGAPTNNSSRRGPMMQSNAQPTY